LSRYAVGKIVGEGAFGTVRIGVCKATEEHVALKTCEKARSAPGVQKQQRALDCEIRFLRRVEGHRNVVKTLEVVECPTSTVLVMEYCGGGDLHSFVRRRQVLSEGSARGFFGQLLEGLHHIHSCAVVHRDLKLGNLLLDRTCLKIADFGVAAVVKSPGQRFKDTVGTPAYMAPEVVLEAGYEGPPVDVWSSGVVLYGMICGRMPFKGERLVELKPSILLGRYELASYLHGDDGANVAAFLGRLLVVDPRERAGLHELRSHRWLGNVVPATLGVALATSRSRSAEPPSSALTTRPVVPLLALGCA
jgi:serine/threonine protein kinase